MVRRADTIFQPPVTSKHAFQRSPDDHLPFSRQDKPHRVGVNRYRPGSLTGRRVHQGRCRTLREFRRCFCFEVPLCCFSWVSWPPPGPECPYLAPRLLTRPISVARLTQAAMAWVGGIGEATRSAFLGIRPQPNYFGAFICVIHPACIHHVLFFLSRSALSRGL